MSWCPFLRRQMYSNTFIHMETCFLQYRFTQIFRVCRLILKTVQKKVEVNGESAVLYSKQDNSRTALYYLLNGKSIYIAGTLSEREIVDIAENLTA